MPHICLANANVPDGTLQITDLWPSESQRNNAIDPPGQTRYLTRVDTDAVVVSTTTGTLEKAPSFAGTSLRGLGAYLADKVVPWTLWSYTQNILFGAGAVLAGDTLTLKGVVFRFAAGANDLVHAGTALDPVIIGLGAGDLARDTNLAAALNNAGVKALMYASEVPGFAVVAVAMGVGDLMFFSALSGSGNYAGGSGSVWTFATSNPAAIVRTELMTNRVTYATDVNRIAPWTQTTLGLAVADILARVDAGSSLTITNVNAILATRAGSQLTTATASSSHGTLAELLSVLSGRGYEVPVGSVKATVVPVTGDDILIWGSSAVGSFTEINVVHDTQMLGGELAPLLRGGDRVSVELHPVRHTYDTTALQVSAATGQIAHFASGVTLFPDAEVQARVAPFLASKNPRLSTLTGQRLVTVYNDDGTVLA